MNAKSRFFHLYAAFVVISMSLFSFEAAGQQSPDFGDVIYARVNNTDLKLDIYLPQNSTNPPLIVQVHGGAWRFGTKQSGVPLALVEQGYALASLDFRQSTDAPFPAMIHDIKAAIRFLRANAARYGFTAEKIAITGASSGAHLAQVVGVSNGHPILEGNVGNHPDTSSDVQAIVSYFGASDLTTILSQSTPFGLEVRTPALELLLGSLPEQNPALAKLASPVSLVNDDAPPIFIFHCLILDLMSFF